MSPAIFDGHVKYLMGCIAYWDTFRSLGSVDGVSALPGWPGSLATVMTIP